MSPTHRDSELLTKFEAFELGAGEFGHREHVAVAHEMLLKYGFLKTMSKFPSDIKTFATNVGAPKKFHVTITLAFLSLIAERMRATESTDFESFAAANEDLFESDILNQWYSTERLTSDAARTQFLLPDR